MRAALAVLLLVAAVAGGLALRDRRTPDLPTDSTAAAPSPSASPATPKWYTRRLALPDGAGVWSLRISPDGSALAALSADQRRITRFAVSDPPGEITATLTPVATSPHWSGFGWLSDGGLAVGRAEGAFDPKGKAVAKSVEAVIVEADGSPTQLGTVQGASFGPPPLSPDGKWLAWTEWSPPQIRLIARDGAAEPRLLPLGDIGLPTGVLWTSDGRLIHAKGGALELIAVDGKRESVAAPRGVELIGVDVASPDRQVTLVRTRVVTPAMTREGLIAFVSGRWVDVPQLPDLTFVWIGGHELVIRAPSGALTAFDAVAGKTRDLGFTLKAAEPRVLAFSDPYLMWRDGDKGRVHLLDTRSAYDVLVGTEPVVGAQPYKGGGFLIVHEKSAELLTGDDWFARVPPTAAPFKSAAPQQPGARDPFADIAALPRLDQFTTGGALEVGSRTATTKRVQSPDGGWSMEVPADWRADVGRLRGGDLYSFDPTGRDFGGNAPSPGEMRLSIELWPDFEQRGPAWFADNESGPYPGTGRERATVRLAGLELERLVMKENQPTEFLRSARWYVRHPSFADRVFAVRLFRAEPDQLAAAERVLGTLKLFAPVSGPRGPLLSRAEAIAKATAGSAAKAPQGTPERVAAKLATNKEWELAGLGSHSYSLDADTPVWLVVRYGKFENVPTRGLIGDQQTFTWLFAAIDARTGQGFSGGGGGGDGPAWFDALRDRAGD